MRIIFVTFLILLATSSSWAQIGMSGGLGIMSDKGIVGAGIDYRFENQSLVQADLGADVAGPLMGVMYKHPIYSQSSGTKWYEKCLFTFDCETLFYLGAGLKSFSPHEAILRKGEADEAEYKVAQKFAAGLTFTIRDEYRNNFFFDVDISYRTRLTNPDITPKRGVQKTGDEDKIRDFDNVVGVGLILGYRF